MRNPRSNSVIDISHHNGKSLHFDKAKADVRTELFVAAAALQEEFPAIRSINPLPMSVDAMRPTTGYDDVKSVAIARLAAPDIPTVQVDWLRYGPKLAQVALTFGADDIDTLTVKHNLAIRIFASDSARAGELSQQVYQARVRLLGLDHPHTLVSLHTLLSMDVVPDPYTDPIEAYKDLIERRRAALVPA